MYGADGELVSVDGDVLSEAFDPTKPVEVHGRAGTCVPIEEEVTVVTEKVN